MWNSTVIKKNCANCCVQVSLDLNNGIESITVFKFKWIDSISVFGIGNLFTDKLAIANGGFNRLTIILTDIIMA